MKPRQPYSGLWVWCACVLAAYCVLAAIAVAGGR